MQCGEIQGWHYRRRDTGRRVEKCRHWIGHKLSTGDPTAMNSSAMVNQRNADLDLGTVSFRGKKENKETVSPTLKRHCI